MNKDSASPLMLVTGVSGLMGANFALCASQGRVVTGVYSRHRVAIPKVSSASLDIRDPIATLAKLNELQPSTIVHFAAATDVDWCEEHRAEALQMNVKATGFLAHWSAANGCKFVFLSTDSVFDGMHGSYEETDRTNPLNAYAESKWQAEEVIRASSKNHLIVRSNIFGWNVQNKSSLAEWVLNNLEVGNSIKGFADVVFTPLLVNTLAEIMLQLIDRNETGTFHAASADAVSKYEFAAMISDVFGMNSRLIDKSALASQKLRAPRPLNTSLKTRKLDDLNIPVPRLRDDIVRFKQLYDTSYVFTLKNMNRSTL